MAGGSALPATGTRTAVAQSATLRQKDLKFMARLLGFIEQPVSRIMDLLLKNKQIHPRVSTAFTLRLHLTQRVAKIIAEDVPEGGASLPTVYTCSPHMEMGVKDGDLPKFGKLRTPSRHMPGDSDPSGL